MSYTHGIGASQPFPSTTEASASSSASRTETTPLATSQPYDADAASGLDKTQLSSTASVISQALSGSDARMDKVTALQQTIAAGTYSVPSSDVADKVISALID